MTKDEVIRKYAAEAERVYVERTTGDHTWQGFLADFAREMENADA